MKNASCRWTEVIRWKLTNFMIFLGFRGFRPLFQGMTPLYRMQFSKYSNSKAWFQILSLSHWSIQFDFLPKFTHKSVALISKITVCFGSPSIWLLKKFCQNLEYVKFSSKRHLFDRIQSFLQMKNSTKWQINYWKFLSNLRKWFSS